MIDSLITNLAQGNRDTALSSIMHLYGGFGPNAVSTPAALVDKLTQCRFLSSETRPTSPSLHYLTWHCPDTNYMSVIYRGPTESWLTVVQFVTLATWDIYTHQPVPVPPPMPPRR